MLFRFVATSAPLCYVGPQFSHQIPLKAYYACENDSFAPLSPFGRFLLLCERIKRSFVRTKNHSIRHFSCQAISSFLFFRHFTWLTQWHKQQNRLHTHTHRTDTNTPVKRISLIHYSAVLRYGHRYCFCRKLNQFKCSIFSHNSRDYRLCSFINSRQPAFIRFMRWYNLYIPLRNYVNLNARRLFAFKADVYEDARHSTILLVVRRSLIVLPRDASCCPEVCR